MEIIVPTSREEALSALTHAVRVWDARDINDQHLENEKGGYLDWHFKYAEKLGANQVEILRAVLMGTENKSDQQAHLNLYFDGLLRQGMEQIFAELPGLINIKNEFDLKDPSEEYFKD